MGWCFSKLFWDAPIQQSVIALHGKLCGDYEEVLPFLKIFSTILWRMRSLLKTCFKNDAHLQTCVNPFPSLH